MMLLRLITWPYVRRHRLRTVLTTVGILGGGGMIWMGLSGWMQARAPRAQRHPRQMPLGIVDRQARPLRPIHAHLELEDAHDADSGRHPGMDELMAAGV